MPEKFTWERGPFVQCPLCDRQDTYGLLSAGGTGVTMRCTECRYSETERLPGLDKKLIYLDQFAFSNLFHVRSGGNKLGALQEFWSAALEKLNRVVLLQQVLLPHSNVHEKETLVSRHHQEIRECYEQLGGQAEFERIDAIQETRTWELFTAFMEGREPVIDLSPDAVLRSQRNDWLSDMMIYVNADYSQFAEGQRATNRETEARFASLVEGWIKEGPSYETIVERELNIHGQSQRQSLSRAHEELELAAARGDLLEMLNVNHRPIMREFAMLHEGCVARGVPEDETLALIIRFWDWDKHKDQPESQIAAHMFAALARKVVAGQRKLGASFLNDVSVISLFAPSVDAMFVDRECAGLLQEIGDRVHYRARIFSLATPGEFLAYLDEIAESAPGDVRGYAERIYGVH